MADWRLGFIAEALTCKEKGYCCDWYHFICEVVVYTDEIHLIEVYTDEILCWVMFSHKMLKITSTVKKQKF